MTEPVSLDNPDRIGVIFLKEDWEKFAKGIDDLFKADSTDATEYVKFIIKNVRERHA